MGPTGTATTVETEAATTAVAATTAAVVMAAAVAVAADTAEETLSSEFVALVEKSPGPVVP